MDDDDDDDDCSVTAGILMDCVSHKTPVTANGGEEGAAPAAPRGRVLVEEKNDGLSSSSSSS